MVKNIRESEKALLRLLDDNSRMSFSKIGKKIKKSQQLVSYNVNALIKEGVIKRFYTIIDYSKLGVFSFRVYFRIIYGKEEKFEEFIKYLVRLENTSWIARCGGTYDLVCTFFAANPSRFKKRLMDIVSRFPEQINDYTVLTTVVIRNYKLPMETYVQIKEIIIGGDREKEEIDENNIKILNMISGNARISALELNKTVNLTPKTIIERIKWLEKEEIICGYRPLLDLKKVGYISNVLLIKYHNASTDAEEELEKFLKVHGNVVSVVRTLGEWDIEVEIVVERVEQFRRIEMEIRQRFASLIKDINSIPLYETFKKDFFPESILN